MKRAILVFDVQLFREFGSLIPSALRRADEKPRELRVIHDHAQAELRHRDHRAHAIDHATHRRPLVTDDHRVRHHGAEPVEKIQHLRTADAGKEVFVSAGEAHDLMREDRPADDELVVVEDARVDLHRHLHGDKPGGQRAGVVEREVADVAQRGFIIPLVIEKAHARVSRESLLGGDLQPRANRLLAQRLMRAERDHHVEVLHHAADLRMQPGEEHPKRTSPRRIRHDEQDSFVAVILRRTRLRDQRQGLRGVETGSARGDVGERGGHGKGLAQTLGGSKGFSCGCGPSACQPRGQRPNASCSLAMSPASRICAAAVARS